MRTGEIVCTTTIRLTHKEDRANAALIAKAPDMYNLLKLWAKSSALGSQFAEKLIGEIDGETK